MPLLNHKEWKEKSSYSIPNLWLLASKHFFFFKGNTSIIGLFLLKPTSSRFMIMFILLIHLSFFPQSSISLYKFKYIITKQFNISLSNEKLDKNFFLLNSTKTFRNQFNVNYSNVINHHIIKTNLYPTIYWNDEWIS